MEYTANNNHIKDNLIKAIAPIILKNGLKATTMDYVASSLSISKRTLYEVFENKSIMLKEALDYINKKHLLLFTDIFESSGTVMEALFRVLKSTQAALKFTSVEFYRDMDTYYKDLRQSYDKLADERFNSLMKVIETGIEQNVFRKDVNYRITLRMFEVQMELLKRMEEFLPGDVTLPEAFDSVSISFLRSIASTKGMGILDEIQKMDIPEINPYMFDTQFHSENLGGI